VAQLKKTRMGLIIGFFIIITACHSKQILIQPMEQPTVSALIATPFSTTVKSTNKKSIPIPIPIPTHAEKGKTAYLTFDDGPSTNTEAILAILKQYSVHVTFFVNGNSTMNGQRLYRRMLDEGHVIGNHTYTHDYASIYSSVQAFDKDTERLSKLLEQFTGIRPTLLRYPGGSNNKVSHQYGGSKIMQRIIAKMNQENFTYTDWNVSSTDAALPMQSKKQIISAVLNGSRNKKEVIILMHDDAKKINTVSALSEIITGLQKMGFKFEVLGKNKFSYVFNS
jgi:peptidoglycan/xylan/chitin deacetylase (PgdA/CDA1 family)